MRFSDGLRVGSSLFGLLFLQEFFGIEFNEPGVIAFGFLFVALEDFRPQLAGELPPLFAVLAAEFGFQGFERKLALCPRSFGSALGRLALAGGGTGRLGRGIGGIIFARHAAFELLGGLA